jgi:membrane protein implicated in regulation of membrane protease activity
VRHFFKLVRLGFEWGGNAALLWQLGVPGLPAAVLAGVLDLPLPFRIVVFVSVFFIVLGLLLAAIGRRRESEDVVGPRPAGYEEAESEVTKVSTERVGIRNRGRGKSHSTRPTFGSDLDVAIDNSDGGESTDEDATFR